MMNRHDSDMAIVSRLYNDEEYDWYAQLNKIIANHSNSNNVKLYEINANRDFNTVVENVHALIASETR